MLCSHAHSIRATQPGFYLVIVILFRSYPDTDAVLLFIFLEPHNFVRLRNKQQVQVKPTGVRLRFFGVLTGLTTVI